ncbi:MAG: hypothetical protein ACTSUK_01005 [Promethearchaeota archaeon]
MQIVLIILTAINVLMFAGNAFLTQSYEPTDLSGYESHLEEIDKRLDDHDSTLTVKKEEFKTIIYEVIEKDSIIEVSNGPKLDSLFSDFFDRTK